MPMTLEGLLTPALHRDRHDVIKMYFFLLAKCPAQIHLRVGLVHVLPPLVMTVTQHLQRPGWSLLHLFK